MKKYCMLLIMGLCALTARAQVPGIINYQGRIVDGGTNFNGTGQFEFALVNGGTNTAISATATAVVTSGFVTGINVTLGGSGYTSAPPVTITGGGGSLATATAHLTGSTVSSISVNTAGRGYTSQPTVNIAVPPPSLTFTTFWSNDGSSVAGGQPATAVSLTVTKGLYAVLLGDTTIANMTVAVPAAAFTNANVRLRVWFNDGVSGFQQLAPDQRLGAAGYALNAALAQTAVNIVPTSIVQAQQLNIGIGNTLSGTLATIAGGSNNTASGTDAAVGGGIANTAGGTASFVGGGAQNTTSGGGDVIGGGNLNNSSSQYTTVGGGIANTANNQYATVGGGDHNTASGAGAFVGGGGYDGIRIAGNTASGAGSTVGGGVGNTASIYDSTVGGGVQNTANNANATVGGGVSNNASGTASTVGGGSQNTASGNGAAVAGGETNTASSTDDTVGGGHQNVASGGLSTVGGGQNNIASGGWATVPGGFLNLASGMSSFAAGQGAEATNDGAFVWADRSGSGLISTSNNQFSVRASGGVVFFSNAGATTGVILAPGAGSWSSASDRNLKAHFATVNAEAILQALVAIPVDTWNYKAQDEHILHIGPMAQDFHAAFGVGEDDRHISEVDAQGVAFAAIQGLNQKLEDQVKDKDARISALERRLVELEAQMRRVSDQVEQSKAAPIPVAKVRNAGGM